MSTPDLERSMTPSKTGLGELYDAYFKTRFGFDPRRDLVWKEVVRWIQHRFVPPDARVLDAGAGYCNFINNVTAARRCAVDVFTKFPQFANAGVETHISTCTDMSFFEDDSFDVVFASNLAEHLGRSDLILFLGEVRRVLRLGGLLILMQPNFKFCSATYFDDYTHLQIFTDASLYDFLEAYGLPVRESQPRFMPVNMKSTLR
ncbi:MAG: class I SAM-dependent methyltransferase, partial [Gemmatimonadales bacterium]